MRKSASAKGPVPRLICYYECGLAETTRTGFAFTDRWGPCRWRHNLARLHPTRLAPYSLFVVRLSPDLLQRGENRLTGTLCAQEPNLFGTIALRELELFVNYPDGE